ncbi:MAG: pilus assembly FimT family protein [Candidatus Anammoxibacter sp.]
MLNIMHNQKGFSLMELIIVIAIIGIISAISIPTLFTALHKKRVDQAAQQIVWDLRRARSAAIRHKEDCVVSFSGMGTYTAYLKNTNKNILNGNLKERYPGVEFNCKGDDGNLIGDPVDAVTFKPTRKISGIENRIFIMSTSDLSANRTAGMRKISVSSTGRVKIKKYTSGSCNDSNSWE